MLDPQDEQFDRRLATHLVSLYHQSQEDEEGAYMVGGACALFLDSTSLYGYMSSETTILYIRYYDISLDSHIHVHTLYRICQL